MRCLKCGENIPDGAAFCQNCLAAMEKSPVPKDAVLILPNRSELAARRSYNRRRTQSTEELLQAARERIHNLHLAMAVQFLIIILLTVACVLLMKKDPGPALGQNYSTVSTSATTGSLPTEG